MNLSAKTSTQASKPPGRIVVSTPRISAYLKLLEDKNINQCFITIEDQFENELFVNLETLDWPMHYVCSDSLTITEKQAERRELRTNDIQESTVVAIEIIQDLSSIDLDIFPGKLGFPFE